MHDDNAADATEVAPFNLLGLPLEIREQIYYWAVLSSDWHRIDLKIGLTCDPDAPRAEDPVWCPPPNPRAVVDYAALCRAHPRIAREAWPIYYATVTPQINCPAVMLTPPRLFKPFVERFASFRINNLAYPGVKEILCDLRDLLKRRMSLTKRVVLYVALEDLALAVDHWRRMEVCAGDRDVWDDCFRNGNVGLVVWSYPLQTIDNEEALEEARLKGRSHRAGYTATEAQIAALYNELGLDPNNTLPSRGGWRPELVTPGCRWIQQPKPRRLDD